MSEPELDPCRYCGYPEHSGWCPSYPTMRERAERRLYARYLPDFALQLLCAAAGYK